LSARKQFKVAKTRFN